MKLNQGKSPLPFFKENTDGLLKRRKYSQLDPSAELLERIHLNDPQTWKSQRNVTRRREPQCCWQNALLVPVSEAYRYYWQSPLAHSHPYQVTNITWTNFQTSEEEREKINSLYKPCGMCLCACVCMLQKFIFFLKSNTLSKRKISYMCNHFKIITWFCIQKIKAFAWYEHQWCSLSGVNTPCTTALTQAYWYLYLALLHYGSLFLSLLSENLGRRDRVSFLFASSNPDLDM